VGVGNGGPHNQLMRSPGGGDNLFLASVVALRPQTGEYVWHHQQNPGETWDYTATQQMVLADIEWQGQVRQVLMQAPKNGFFFIYDRATGELLSAEPFVPVNWASHYDLETGRPVEAEGARYKDKPFMLRPTGLGGHNWHSMAYSSQTGLMYIPALDFSAPMENEETYVWYDNHWNLGYKTESSPFGTLLTQAILRRMMHSYLLAWDPRRQQEVWRVPTPLMGNGGVLATAGGLVFQGTTDNRFRAFDANDGRELWDFNAQHGIMAAPVSYSVNGEQYISVMAGRGGGFSMMLGLAGAGETPQRRLLTFKLGGQLRLPAYELPAADRPSPPDYTADPAALDRGAWLYMRFCARCHGAGVVSDGSVPDLRRLENHWYDAFDAVLLQGSMRNMGMPAFDDVLNGTDVAAIRAYVLDKAHEDWNEQHSSAWWLAVRQWWADVVAGVLVYLSQAFA